MHQAIPPVKIVDPTGLKHGGELLAECRGSTMQQSLSGQPEPSLKGVLKARGRKDASSSSDECDIMELEEEPEKTEDYMGALIPLQYDDSVSFQSVTLKHAEPPSKKTVIRIAHELSSFATSSTLPCSASSTIFLACCHAGIRTPVLHENISFWVSQHLLGRLMVGLLLS